jgi:hypothetical protein
VDFHAVKPCFMIREPKICVVYIYPFSGEGGWAPKALEFAQSYERNPPGMNHDTVIVCNGAPITEPSKDLFNALPNRTYLDHDNSGWDIGGFQLAARTVPCDLMLFCGAHTYFRKPGWLARCVEVMNDLGNTLYGSTGNQGDTRFNIYPHVRTTGFWCKPELMKAYPHIITQCSGYGGQRYEAEHGLSCISNWVKSQGKQPWIAGWTEVRPLEDCNAIPNGYHQNDQSNVLIGDRMTMPPYHHCK